MRQALFPNAGLLLAYRAAQRYLVEAETSDATLHLEEAACSHCRCLCPGVFCQSWRRRLELEQREISIAEQARQLEVSRGRHHTLAGMVQLILDYFNVSPPALLTSPYLLVQIPEDGGMAVAHRAAH